MVRGHCAVVQWPFFFLGVRRADCIGAHSYRRWAALFVCCVPDVFVRRAGGRSVWCFRRRSVAPWCGLVGARSYRCLGWFGVPGCGWRLGGCGRSSSGSVVGVLGGSIVTTIASYGAYVLTSLGSLTTELTSFAAPFLLFASALCGITLAIRYIRRVGSSG